MKRIGAAKFREQCLTLLRQLDADGLVITRRGRPVARVLPYDGPHQGQDGDLIGSLRGKIEVRGDVLSTGLRWDADVRS